jgi:hypothetical protein
VTVAAEAGIQEALELFLGDLLHGGEALHLPLRPCREALHGVHQFLVPLPLVASFADAKADGAAEGCLCLGVLDRKQFHCLAQGFVPFGNAVESLFEGHISLS